MGKKSGGGTLDLSPQARTQAIERFKTEMFDVLVVGGGITGVAVARDAASRGLSVALVEKNDFGSGTSSKSSKLIHGGLRYLENFEFGLVFEALSERALLLKTVPHMVRPLPFYFPVYEGDPNPMWKIGLGIRLYDLLSLFRTPGYHRRLNRKRLLEEVPSLKTEGLCGGFRYFDASMWDDALVIEVLRAATLDRVAAANYVEATEPIWLDGAVVGFVAHNREYPLAESGQRGLGNLRIRARRTVICGGPWVDIIGKTLSAQWAPWLKPSQGVHLVFDLKRLPVPGAMVMSHPEDGRISFVMPRPDLGAGVTIVGTTDGPTPSDPATAHIARKDVEYLMSLVNQYFETLRLTDRDILSSYVGVRPLVGQSGRDPADLAKVSREHEIRLGPGGVVMVAGGKYTTHRKMAEQIVDFTLTHARGERLSIEPTRSQTRLAPNPHASRSAMEEAREQLNREGFGLPRADQQILINRFGLEAIDVIRWDRAQLPSTVLDPEGFPCLRGQLIHAVRTSGVLHLNDFYLRRTPLSMSRADHGLPWADSLSRVLQTELSLTDEQRQRECALLRAEIDRSDEWRRTLI